MEKSLTAATSSPGTKILEEASPPQDEVEDDRRIQELEAKEKILLGQLPYQIWELK